MLSYVRPSQLRSDAVAGVLLEDLLLFACEGLQLTRTLHGEAEQHYRGVTKWLSEDDSFFGRYEPDIYPQGSFLIGTTTRPILQCEYDLDFVLQLTPVAPLDPMLLLDKLEQRLREHGTYKEMVKRLKRCVRLVYANRFHLDILPAVSVEIHDTRILVPDRELVGWKSSDPRGFAAWFKSRGLSVRMDKAAKIEPLPAIQSANEKSVLQRVVQLLKRARDRFVTNLELSPRSIVLTTLAGHGYGGQITTAGAMSAVLQHLRNTATPVPPRVFNPVNPEELLSEQWEKSERAYLEFKRWLDWFIGEWSSVMEVQRMPDVHKRLATIFGEDVAVDAIKKHAARMDDLRKAGDLKVRANGALATGGGVAVVRANTFYGDE